MSNDSAPDSSRFEVSTIDIDLAGGSHKKIDSISIELKKKDGSVEKVEKPVSVCAGHGYQQKFEQPLHLDPAGHIFGSARCSWTSSFGRKRVEDLPIDIDLRGEYKDEGLNRRYRSKDRNMEVVVTGRWFDHQSLSRGVAQIIESCPRFRLLVIGNSGVGKSSLIRKVFDVEEVDTSDNGPGIADIDREFVSPKNERFVVHDSLGFEAGDEHNIQKVEKFVIGRRAMPKLTDQLHAVWLCLDIPHAGGRLLEGGVETFLKRRSEILGAIPLVVVLTKVDKLDTQLELEFDPPKNEDVQQYRERYLNENCIKQLRRAAGNDALYAIVSVLDGYSDSLPKLVTTTLEGMVRHAVHEDPRAVATIAQRVSIKEKIELSVQVGKKKYRSVVWGSVIGHNALLGHLEAIRKEVVTIWNFKVTDNSLMDNTIIDALLLADNLGNVSEAPSNNSSFATLIAIFFLSLAGRPLPIENVGPSVSGFTSVIRPGVAHEVKVLMAYIVDLTCAMQIIFLLASGSHVTHQTVKIALRAYETPRKNVHKEVDALDKKPSREMLNEVERLIWLYSISDHEIEGLRKNLPASGSS